MHDRLLEGLGVERVTLAMRPDPEAAPAHAAYAAWGYLQVGHWQPADGQPVSHIVLLTLPVAAQGVGQQRAPGTGEGGGVRPGTGAGPDLRR
ncbi:hypothetical protein [Streptomyces iakyrus]|uniref:hypothetical protein n=1 Tax=Streptomyces iakyrus TaxID=68219 RepID=UPI003D9438B6